MNNKLNRQKHHERFLLEAFIAESKLNAQIIEDREAPDFIVSIDGAQVGIEVTEIFISHGKKANTLQAQEAIADQITTKAKKLYLGAGGPLVTVSLCFAPGHDLQKLNRDKTAQALCDFIFAMNLSTGQRVDWSFSNLEDEEESPLQDEISFVHALGVPKIDSAHWNAVRAGWVASLSPKALQERIDAKAKRLPNYQNIITNNWLLVVANALNPSSSIKAKSEFDTNSISSPFNRTFFYRHPEGFLELDAGN